MNNESQKIINFDAGMLKKIDCGNFFCEFVFIFVVLIIVLTNYYSY